MTTPKFYGDAIGEILHDISLNGCNDDECGDVDLFGFHAVKFEGFSLSDFTRDQLRLIRKYHEEHAQTALRALIESAGAILLTASDGHVRWIGYHDAGLLELAWDRIVAEATEYEPHDEVTA